MKKVEIIWKNEKMLLKSSRICCPEIITWKHHLSSQIRPQKTDQQQQEQQNYVKDPEQECSRSKIYILPTQLLQIKKKWGHTNLFVQSKALLGWI